MQNTISQRGQRYQFDAIIIGSGISGLCCALELINLCPTIKIALLTKEKLHDSNSYYAQGGIAAADSPEDVAQHIADTLAASNGLCNQEAVSSILKQGFVCIQYLLIKALHLTATNKIN